MLFRGGTYHKNVVIIPIYRKPFWMAGLVLWDRCQLQKKKGRAFLRSLEQRTRPVICILPLEEFWKGHIHCRHYFEYKKYFSPKTSTCRPAEYIVYTKNPKYWIVCREKLPFFLIFCAIQFLQFELSRFYFCVPPCLNR